MPSKTEAPVQLGAQNKATDNWDADADGGSAAMGKGATASTTTEQAGTPWYVFTGLVVVGLAGGWVLRNHANKWAWVPAHLKSS